VQRYAGRVSGPILDRIDLRIEMSVPPAECLGRAGPRDASQALRERIADARLRQVRRYAEVEDVYCNAQADSDARRTLLRARREALAFLRQAVDRWHLSVRAYERTLSVARSIADLDGAADVDAHHVAEALQYRVQEG